MRIKLFNSYWNLRFTRIVDDGLCFNETKQIRIRKGLVGVEKLATILHELLHAGDWPLHEGIVDTVSENIAKIIYLTGWQEIKNTHHKKNGSIEELGKLIFYCLMLVKSQYETNEWAENFSDDCAKILWRLGYRKLSGNNK